MTEKRFTAIPETVAIKDNLTNERIYPKYEQGYYTLIKKLNSLWNQTRRFEKHNQELLKEKADLRYDYNEKCNEYLGLEEVVDNLLKENVKLKEQNKELEQTIETICDDYEEAHGMDIRNSDWFTAW